MFHAQTANARLRNNPAGQFTRSAPGFGKGNQALLRKAAAGLQRKCAGCENEDKDKLQTKRDVSEPGDPLEREADRVADAVVQAGDRSPPVFPHAGSPSQPEAGAALSAAVPAEVHDALRSGGRPLDRDTRRFAERRFGTDFAHVRIHDGPQAHEAAQSISAHAFTHGSHIVFARGKFDPSRQQGQHLLAHELTHTLQQTSPAAAPSAPALARTGSTCPTDWATTVDADKTRGWV